MGKTLDEIRAQAPTPRGAAEPRAYYCTGCPWWTADIRDAAETSVPGAVEPARCPACSAQLRWLDLADWVALAQDRTVDNPEAWQKFVHTHSRGDYWHSLLVATEKETLTHGH